ncbi:MAG: hypothetical protein BMS9Abin05_2630 [Rhodothermia bacterium]|nr:MAG: hypothetical protein BMS9Abin05_2630 [Rhodothermia bacterium]
MFINRDHHTGSLFNPWEYLGDKRRLLLEKSWAAVFREYLLAELPVAEIGAHFSDDMGRPTKDASMVLGALMLQQLHDYTDSQTVEAVALSIQWQYALDITRETDAYVCERTLRNYRRLVIERGLDEVMFRTLTDKLISSVGVDTSRQRLDSTAIRSAMRSLSRLGTIVETVSKFLRELKRMHPALFDGVGSTDWRRYVDRTGDGCFALTVPSESKRRLPEAARDLYRLVEQFRLTKAANLHSYQLLARVLGEQCVVVEDYEDQDDGPTVVVKAPQDVPCDNVVNPADPDTSYNTHRGLGYLVQIMESYSDKDALDAGIPKPDLITHVALGKMTTHDQDALKPALSDTQDRNVGPDLLLADAHYGSNECVKEATARGVELLSPVVATRGKKQKKLTLEDFELDALSGFVLRCPEGHEPVATRATPGYLHVRFDESTCAGCAMGARCDAFGKARLRYTRARVKNRTKRLVQREPRFRDRYRMRSGIEATMSHYKRQMNMARLRVGGMEAVRYRAVLRALGLNIFRVTAWRRNLC